MCPSCVPLLHNISCIPHSYCQRAGYLKIHGHTHWLHFTVCPGPRHLVDGASSRWLTRVCCTHFYASRFQLAQGIMQSATSKSAVVCCMIDKSLRICQKFRSDIEQFIKPCALGPRYTLISPFEDWLRHGRLVLARHSQSDGSLKGIHDLHANKPPKEGICGHAQFEYRWVPDAVHKRIQFAHG